MHIEIKFKFVKNTVGNESIGLPDKFYAKEAADVLSMQHRLVKQRTKQQFHGVKKSNRDWFGVE